MGERLSEWYKKKQIFFKSYSIAYYNKWNIFIILLFQLNITWKAETEVFEYPSFESSKDGAEEDSGSRGNSTSGKPIQSMKTNTSVKNNSSGKYYFDH